MSNSTHFLAAFRATFSKSGKAVDGTIELTPFAFDMLEEAARKADRTARDAADLSGKVARWAEADRVRMAHALERGDMLTLCRDNELNARTIADLHAAVTLCRDAYETMRDGIQLVDEPSWKTFRAALTMLQAAHAEPRVSA